MLIVACAALAITACTKPEEKDSKMSTPTNKEFHASYTLTDNTFAAPLKNGSIPKTIELTTGGKFVLGFLDTDALEPGTDPLKAEPTIFKSGTYTVTAVKSPSAGLIYTFPKYGTLTIKEGSGDRWVVNYTTAGGDDYTGNAITAKDKITGSTANEVCRSWKPVSILVSASGGDLENAIVGKKFSADINEICQYLKENGVKIDVDEASKYALESIDFTETGRMFIIFKDFAISPFVGNFSLNESKDENLAYDFSLSWEDNPVIPVKGEGSIHVSDGQLTLHTESDVTIQDKTYHIGASILCNEIK